MAELTSAYPHPSTQARWKHLKKVMCLLVGILLRTGWIFVCFTVSTTSMFIILAEVYNLDYIPGRFRLI